MQVKLLYFAWVREKTGKAEEQIDLPAGVTTVGELMDWLKGRGPEYAEAFRRAEVIRAAIDRTHVRPGASIAGASEIAFFPPVTGG
jgi:sulfur-carrier protein